MIWEELYEDEIKRFKRRQFSTYLGLFNTFIVFENISLAPSDRKFPLNPKS